VKSIKDIKNIVIILYSPVCTRHGTLSGGRYRQ